MVKCESSDTANWYSDQTASWLHPAASLHHNHLVYVPLLTVKQNSICNCFYFGTFTSMTGAFHTARSNKRQTQIYAHTERFDPNIQWNAAGKFGESCGKRGKWGGQLVSDKSSMITCPFAARLYFRHKWVRRSGENKVGDDDRQSRAFIFSEWKSGCVMQMMVVGMEGS